MEPRITVIFHQRSNRRKKRDEAIQKLMVANLVLLVIGIILNNLFL